MKLDVPKRVFDRTLDISAIQFQTVTGGRKRIGVQGTRAFVELPFMLPSYTAAEADALPEKTVAGAMIYITDDLAGSPTLVVSDGTNWKPVSAVVLPSYTVAEANALSEKTDAGAMVYVTDGLAGAPTLAISDGTDWKTASSNATISAT